jgi:geranylgeranylglycerol-phosphate geranylgeranyltransferase
MAAAAVLVGAFVTRRPPAWGSAVLAGACTVLAASAANALNDVLDRVADAVNRPERPVPAGRLTPRTALWTAGVLYVATLGLAALLGPRGAAVVGAWVGLTALYSAVLKGVPVFGNAVVSLVAASPFVLGAVSQGPAAPALVPTGLAFLVHLAREAVKTAEDAPGDARAGVRTLAVAAGERAALRLARIVVVITLVAAPAPYFAGLYGIGYALAVVVVEVALGVVLYVLARAPERAALRLASNGLKLVMLVGLVAFIAGVIS